MEQREKNTELDHSFHKHYGVVDGAEALVLKHLATQHPKKTIIYVTRDDGHMQDVQSVLSFFGATRQILSFPAWDCLPYDRVSPGSNVIGRRLAVLDMLLKQQEPVFLLTTVNAIVQKLIPKDVLQGASFSVQKNQALDISLLQKYLADNGYHRVETVREAGEYAVRGSIIDIYPAADIAPIRIDLFGDDVENLKHFDAVSQRSTEDITGFDLGPVSEIFLNEDTIKHFRGAYRGLFGAVVKKEDDPLYNAVSEGRKHGGAEHWLPLFYETMDTLFDYAGDALLVFAEQIENARQNRLEQIYDFYDARHETLETTTVSAPYKPIPPESLYIDHQEWAVCLEKIADNHVLLPFSAPDEETASFAKKGRNFADIRVQENVNVYDALIAHIKSVQKGKKRVVLAGYSEGACTRLKTVLAEHGFANTEMVGSWVGLTGLKPSLAAICVLPLEYGFETDDFVIVTEQDILGERLIRPTAKKKKRRKLKDVLDDLSVLSEGDYVVHEEHGIGQFGGLETLTVQNVPHDFLKIMYAENDKLFVPVEHIEVLSRYGTDNSIVALDRLGGAGWQTRKSKVKKDLMEIAEELMKVAAARVLRRTDRLEIADSVYQEFAARFPYAETEDQDNAISDVIEDLKQEHAMDRLICGDVGFGKTEVALRAACVAALAGVQVAILTPTTLLARQHYKDFFERFRGFGIRIEQLSRLVTPKDADKTRKGLRNGDVNIVVGTHALLSDKIKFNHLGLVIVDEEQRFGVKQKEKLKQLREQAHILTMTATPIPRTMQLSMAGIRDMSLITTPPVDRLAIRSFISPFDSVVIREALMREYNRGGQSFYVCPRVADIAKLEARLRDLVPELKFTTAHGQMTTEELESRISAFYDGKYDILLSTTIIESGLDIPNANTMIVHRADMFGLAQLYQIRGRIGRSKQRGYAYLTYDDKKPLTKTALQRLQVMDQLDMLGAGFQLASHDLDIRGAGNLLGEDQSGHIREIGVELYQKMLEEAVFEIRTRQDSAEEAEDETTPSWTPQINMGIAVMIPERYVPDLHLRLSLYRRLGDVQTAEDIDSFAAEMIDRFGEYPEEVENLLQTITIKHMCRKAGVEKLEAGPKGAVVSFHNNQFPEVEKLVHYIAESSGTVKLRPDETLVYIRSWYDKDMRAQGCKRILQELIDLCDTSSETAAA